MILTRKISKIKLERSRHYSMNAAARSAHISRLTKRMEGKRSDYSARIMFADIKSKNYI